MKCSSPRRRANYSSATNILFARKDSFHSREQVGASSSFHNITQCAQAERLLHYILGGFLGQKNYFGAWNDLADLPASLNSIQTGETDVEQNQIGVKFFGLLDGG
jgi:hypothetical protein